MAPVQGGGGGAVTLAKGILSEALKAVPAMRYALAVGGLGAVVSLVLIGLKLDAQTAVIGGLIVLALMVVLFVFSRLAASKGSFKTLTTAMAWSFTLLAFAATLLFLSCFFLDIPKTIPCLLRYDCGAKASPVSQRQPPTDAAVITAPLTTTPPATTRAIDASTVTPPQPPATPHEHRVSRSGPTPTQCSAWRSDRADLAAQFQTPCSAIRYPAPADQSACSAAQAKIQTLDEKLATCR